MPNINLIATRREEKQKLERLAGRLFIGLGSSVGVLLALSAYMGARHLSMSAEISAADQRMQKLQPTLDEIARVEKARQDLLPKVEQLETAKVQTLRWHALFGALSKATPGDTWLGQVATSEGERPSVTIQGQTGNAHMVAEMVKKLQNEPIFLRVDLRNTSAVNAAPPPGSPPGTVVPPRYQFDIQGELKPIGKPQAGPEIPKDPRTAQAEGGNRG